MDEHDARRLVCRSMDTWINAIEAEHGDEPRWTYSIEAVRHTFLLIRKSALLDRLIYGGEQLRTEKCPKHLGHWSGLPSSPNECPHGCQLTGWLPLPPPSTQD